MTEALENRVHDAYFCAHASDVVLDWAFQAPNLAGRYSERPKHEGLVYRFIAF